MLRLAVTLSLFTICVVWIFPASGAVFHMMDGTTITGAIVEEREESVLVLDAKGKLHTLVFDEVLGADLQRGQVDLFHLVLAEGSE